MEGRSLCAVAHLALLGVKRQETALRIYYCVGICMKSKLKNIILVLLLLAVASVIVTEIKSHIKRKKVDNDTASEEQAEVDMSLYYSYSDVKGDISYLAKDDSMEESLSRLVDVLSESEPINVAYIKNICKTIGVEDVVYKAVLGDLKDEDYVKKEQFDEIYENIVNSGKVQGLDEFQVFVFDVKDIENDNEDYKKSVYDGSKNYSFSVDIPDEYLNKIIDVYAKNNIVYKITGYSEGSIMLKNVWVENTENGACTFLYNGIEKNYSVNINQEALDNCVADITISNSGIEKMEKLNSISQARITKVSDEYLFVDSDITNGIRIADGFMIYDVSGEKTCCETDRAILLGYYNVDLIKKDDMAVAVIIRDELIDDEIRVILSNDDYSSYDMEEVKFTSDGSFSVTYPDGKKTTYEGGAEVTVNIDSYENEDIIKIDPVDKKGIKILSLNRGYGNPVYEGSLEVDIHEENLNIINIVPMETYLYSVVSSEMASGGYPEELKAVAVCCRAYAYSKMYDGSFADYNANLDDSSLCQLYNESELRDDCIQAVKDTYGIVPTYDNIVITPLTYSTCYGVTSTNDEVWGGNQYFYFFSRVDNDERTKIDLSNEDDFIRFLSDSMGYDTVEKDMPYYRWSIDFSFDEMSNAIDSMLAKRASISTDNIQIKTGEDTYETADIDSIGEVLDISVIERTSSGVVSALLIEGSEATIKVTGASNIRNIITPVNQQIIRQDGSVITGWTSLPSPYYYIEKTTSGYTVHGGGFGYGVGLSKNGAANLAAKGYNYKYIVHHYYAYVKFMYIYNNTITVEDTDEETEANEALDETEPQ